MAARPGKLQAVNEYEQQRLDRIAANQAKLGKATLSVCGTRDEAAAWLHSKERRCGQKGRGSIYDNVAGITCHFCRQKKLCGEEGCGRCSERDVNQLEAVREQMAHATWLCPHCYEEDHPEEDWICNSSICMTKRGLKPTGIAIFEAQQQGFASVAHYVQAVSGVPVFHSSSVEGAKLLSSAVSGDSGHQLTSADQPINGACGDAAVISCSCEPESSKESQTAGLALTPDSPAVGKDGQPDPVCAHKRGKQEGADGSSKASVQPDGKKNAPVAICDRGLEARAMPPAKCGVMLEDADVTPLVAAALLGVVL
ncbi:MAG: hypothetical protein FRX49_07071 [Trebouxia sp. A1-2]|nr:MAG: hypothetical protein FRX49_07071 [Trebouxia sp. A1-2]